MIRCALLTLASVMLRVAKPEYFRLGGKLGLSSSQLVTLHWYLKWALPLWAVLDLNSVLNRFAERRWIWKTDKSIWDWKREVAMNLPSYDTTNVTSHRETTSTEAAEAIRSDLGSPTILINNAGIGNAWTIKDIPEQNLNKMFDINLLSHWSTVQEFLPDMLAKKKGHIMGVASLASFVALAGAVDYSCTKAALLAFHEGLTQEIKHRYKCPSIQTSIVHPNWTKSAITSHEAIAAGLKNVRAKILQPEDVAEAMVDQISQVKSGQLILGPALSPKIRALPLWIQELIRDSQAYVVTGDGSTASG
ncbi:unnamed protein product [Alternaria alternata]